ncbi:hypothetical protein [Virgisporangium ochraceum]|uniref:Uncharacterized protein n=1 Tax=Virgisporangium ochraceum TaxID=65505 RepID=A0A8J4E9B8_9ACTN|nr:hypothetical protein [Virgisporangium ochraceum]GIJ66279.1 hypothetical protein Voc01_011960 [Virgisporangium ochraceum]
MKARIGPVAAQDLQPGDIVHEYLLGVEVDDDKALDAVREYAEVRHVEPVVGRNQVLVVFAGGKTVTWLDHGDIQLADPDAYEQHQVAIRDQQARETTIARLQRLIALIQSGAPVGPRLEVKFGGLSSPEAVRQLATLLGSEVDERESEYAFTTSLDCELENGLFEVYAHHYRHKTLAEQRAYREQKAAAEADLPTEDEHDRAVLAGGAA